MFGKYPYILNENLLDDVEVDEVEDVDGEYAGSQDYDLDLFCKVDRDYFGPRAFVVNNMKRKLDAFFEYQRERRKSIDSFEEVGVECPDVTLKINIRFSASFGTLTDFNAFLFGICNVIAENSFEKDDSKFNGDLKIPFVNLPNTVDKPYFVFPSKQDVFTNKPSIAAFYKYFIPTVDEDEAFKSYIKSAIRYNRIECVDKVNGLYKIRDRFCWRLVDSNGEILTSEKFDSIDEFHDGFAKVAFEQQASSGYRTYAYNFIDTKGKLLGDYKFTQVDTNGFKRGCVAVKVYDPESRDYKWNFIDKNCKFLFDEPFDSYDDYRDGTDTIIVRRNGNRNFLDKNYKLLSKIWFASVDRFHNGFSIVTNDKNLQNFLGLDGNLLSSVWFDSVYQFKECGLAIVCKDNHYYIIDKNGDLLRDGESYDGVVINSHDSVIRVNRNGYNNIMDVDGNYFLDDWYCQCGAICDEIMLVLNKQHQVNFVNIETGKLLSEQWFDRSTIEYELNFKDGYQRVKLDKKTNFIDKDGNYLYDGWFRACDDFSEGFAFVMTDDFKANYIDTDGNFITDVEFSSGFSFNGGFAKILNNNDRIKHVNYLKTDGTLLSKTWFYDGDSFSNGIAKVMDESKKENFLKNDGTLLSKVWFDNVSGFKYNVANVVLDGVYTAIDKDGNVIFDKKTQFRYLSDSFEYCIVINSDMKQNILDLKTAKLLSPDRWFKTCSNFDIEAGFAVVEDDDGKHNFIKSDGTCLVKDFVDNYKIDKDEKKIEIQTGFYKAFVDFDGNLITAI